VIHFEKSVAVGGFILPAEVAIVVFNLAVGELKTFHRFIEPGPIQGRYIGEAKFGTEQKHGIPFKDFKQAEHNYKKLWADICSFIQPPMQNVVQQSPILFREIREVEEMCYNSNTEILLG
jgi:hypothetical protein